MSNPSDSLRYGCTECGKVCEPKEYHPYWHCLLFKAGNYEVAMKDIKAHSLQERIDELKETVIAQGTFPEDRSYGHGSFHHVPAEEVEARIKQLEAEQEAL